MALEERTIRYETLIRWHEDGRIGAQQIDLDQVLKNGVVISSVPTQPMQLATADFDGAVKLSDVLGEAVSRALIQVDQLSLYVNQLEQNNKVLSDQVAEISQQAQSLADQLQTALAEVERLATESAHRESEVIEVAAE